MNRQKLCPTFVPCRRCRRAGLIMPLVLIAMGISMILGLAFLSGASTASATAAGSAARLNARMIAESGIAVALAQIDSDPQWRTAFKKAEWVAAQPLGGGTFSIEVEDGDQVDATGKVVGDNRLDDDDQDPVVITCVGVYGDTRHRVRAVRYVPGPTGIAVGERVSLQRNALVDSYDSAVPYTAATARARARASSNGISRRPYILLRNNSRVNGDVYYGPGGSMAGSVRQDATAIVTGTIGPLPSAVDRVDIVEPTWTGASVGDRSYSSGVTTITTDTWYDDLDLSGTAILRIVGDVKIRVEEDMMVQDSARIQLGYPVAYAGAVKGAIEVLDGSTVDSFDSAVGPYGGANAGSQAVLATNATTAATVIVRMGTVKGSIFTGAGSNPSTTVVTIGSAVTGQASALAAPLTIPPNPPAWPTNVGTNIGNYDAVPGVNPPIAANMYAERFRAVGGAIVQVSGHRVMRVNREFTIDDTSRLDILPDSSLTVYVGEAIKLTGSAQANTTTRDASKLVFYGMAAGYVHTFDGDSAAYAVVDAPTASVVVTGTANLYGTVMANALAVKNGAALHVDHNPALATAFPRLPVTFSSGNKLTLYTHESLTICDSAKINADGTPDPLNMQIYHLADEPLRVQKSAVGYAETHLRENALEISGNARWTGKIRTRDLTVSGTAIVTADASGTTDDPGIVVEETLEMRDGAQLQPVPGSGTALVASHGATDTTIRLRHYSVFKGDGYTTPGGYPSDEIRVASTATFTGIKSALDVPVDLSAPPRPPVIGSPSDRNFTGSSTTVLSGDVYAKCLYAKDDAVIEIDGVTRIILTGDLRFSKNAKLRLRPFAKLTIFCPATVRFQDGVQVNLGGNPSRLTIAYVSTSERSVKLEDNAKVCGTILGPAAELQIEDRGEFFGAYRGKRLTMDRDAKMHCSEDGPVPITWLEQQ